MATITTRSIGRALTAIGLSLLSSCATYAYPYTYTDYGPPGGYPATYAYAPAYSVWAPTAMFGMGWLGGMMCCGGWEGGWGERGWGDRGWGGGWGEHGWGGGWGGGGWGGRGGWGGGFGHR